MIRLGFLCVVLIVTLSIGGCGGGKEGQRITNAFGFEYISDTNQISIYNKYPEKNVVQLSRSKNGRCVIYSKALIGESVNIFKMCENDASPERITQSDGIEFDPAINDRGDIAYIRHTYSIKESEVYLNSSRIDLPTGFYDKLLFADDKLIWHYARFYDDTDWLFVYDIKTRDIQKYQLTIIPSEIIYSDIDKLIIQGMLKNNGMSSVGIFNISTYTYQNLCNAPCGFNDNYSKMIFMDFGELSDNDALKILGVQKLRNNDPLFSLSAINNNLGRLSWSVSYNLHSLLKIHEKNLDMLPNADEFIRIMVSNLLASARFDDEHPGWPTKKYSINRDKLLSLLVDDAMILHPLLKAYNMGLIDAKTGQKILGLAEKIFEYHESDYETSTSFYHFRKNIDFALDGVWLPFNQQNAFGSALIQLYKATGDIKYKNRVFQLAWAFKSEFQYTPDGGLVWHYWPKFFYDGWSELDGISKNTPKRVASTDAFFEDISHAAINLEFINEFIRIFPNEIFETSDIEGLRRTLQSIRYINGYSRFMSGDVNYQPANWNFFPDYSWLTLGDDILKTQLRNGVIFNRPYFEGSLLLPYSFALSH